MKIVRRGALPGRRRVGAARRPRPRGRRASGREPTRSDGSSSTTSGRRTSSACSRSSTSSAIRPLKVVIDAANGMAGVMLPPMLERLPIDAGRYYFEPDGTFPNHEPNPLLPENREFIVAQDARGRRRPRRRVRRRRRPLLLRRRHRRVRPRRLRDRPARRVDAREGAGGKIIYDVRASWAVPETIEARGRRAR